MEEKNIITEGYRKITISGQTQYISVPREVREILNTKKGDRVRVAFYWKVVPKGVTKKDKYRKKENNNSMFMEDEGNDLPLLDFKDGNE